MEEITFRTNTHYKVNTCPMNGWLEAGDVYFIKLNPTSMHDYKGKYAVIIPNRDTTIINNKVLYLKNYEELKKFFKDFDVDYHTDAATDSINELKAKIAKIKINHEMLPDTFQEAIDMLKVFFKKHLDEIKNMPEKQFLGSAHFFSGMFIRNQWKLWWQPSWSGEMPLLNAWFELIGITHADDMSGILLTCLHRDLNNVDYDLDSQVRGYQQHWKKHGFPDGIPKREKA